MFEEIGRKMKGTEGKGKKDTKNVNEMITLEPILRKQNTHKALSHVSTKQFN